MELIEIQNSNGTTDLAMYMPEIEQEIYDLFSIAGKIEIMGHSPFGIEVIIHLYKGVYFVSFDSDGIEINQTTGQYKNNRLDIYFRRIPKNYDKEINIGIGLYIRLENDFASLVELRELFQLFARSLNFGFFIS
jgi:hypothetical protein